MITAGLRVFRIVEYGLAGVVCCPSCNNTVIIVFCVQPLCHTNVRKVLLIPYSLHTISFHGTLSCNDHFTSSMVYSETETWISIEDREKQAGRILL